MMRSVMADGKKIDYELVKSKRSSVEIRVLPDKIKLFAPTWLRLKDADSMICERAGWIEEAVERFERYRQARDAEFTMADGMRFPLEGRECTLRVVKAVGAKAEEADGEIVIHTMDDSPENVRALLREYLLARARVRIDERLKYYIPIIGRVPGRVSIREQKTKWGSCSNKGNLNFNWLLIMAPPEALDYVVIHELCHLYEFSHSPKFWALVKSYMPDYEVWMKFLRSGWKKPY